MRIGFGCVNLGSASSAGGTRHATRLVREAIDAGVTLFDTADAYAAGNSERMLGRAIAGRRDEVQIATKGGYVFEERSAVEQQVRHVLGPAVRRVRRLGKRAGVTGPIGLTMYSDQDFSAGHLRSALESSLRRLGTDHVDVYQLHGPATVLPDAVGALQELVDAGLARRVGVGAPDLAAAHQWLPTMEAAGGVLQLPFGPLSTVPADDVLTEPTQGAELWARSVFGAGVLASAARRDDPTLGDVDRRITAGLRSLAAESGTDVFSLAIGYVRAHRSVAAAILGMSSVEHVRRNVELVRSTPPLEPELVTRIRELADGRRNAAS